jgi:hypothetical protein
MGLKVGNVSVCKTTAFYVPTYQAVLGGNRTSIRHYVRNPISGGLERKSSCGKCYIGIGHCNVSHDGSRKCLFSRTRVRSEFDLLSKSLFRGDRFLSLLRLFHEMTLFAKHKHTHFSSFQHFCCTVASLQNAVPTLDTASG